MIPRWIICRTLFIPRPVGTRRERRIESAAGMVDSGDGLALERAVSELFSRNGRRRDVDLRRE